MIEFIRRWYHRYLSTPQSAVLILQFITLFILVYYFNSIIGPILAALVLAFIFERPVSFLVKRGTSRLKASILVTLSYITFVVALVVAILPPAIDQLSNITSTISKTLSTPTQAQQDKVKTIIDTKATVETNQASTLNSATIEVPANKVASPKQVATKPTASDLTQDLTVASNTNSNEATLATVTPNSQVATSNLGTPNSLTTELGTEHNQVNAFSKAELWLIQKVNEYTPKLPEFYRNLITEQQVHDAFILTQNALKNWLSPFLTTKIAPIIMDTFSLLLYFIIVPIFTFYMLKDKPKWIEFGKRYLSPYDEISNFWKTINKQIGQYLSGNIIHIIISASVNGIAFALFGLNYSLLLGIGVGLSVIIPYVGAIIITVPLLLIGVVQFGFTSDFVWLLVIYAVIQLLDSYLLTPLLFSETLNLDAFTILLAIMVFGGIWGFWGVVLAIPLATFFKTAFAMWPKNNLPSTM